MGTLQLGGCDPELSGVGQKASRQWPQRVVAFNCADPRHRPDRAPGFHAARRPGWRESVRTQSGSRPGLTHRQLTPSAASPPGSVAAGGFILKKATNTRIERLIIKLPDLSASADLRRL